MNRREFIGAVALVPRVVQSLATEGWRLFEITTHVHVQNASGITRAWLPTPLVGRPYQQTLGDTYQAEGGRVVMVESEDLDVLYAEWPAGADPILTLTSRVATRDVAADLTMPGVAPPPDLSSFARDLRPTKLIPIDGVVKQTADQITRGAGTDLDKARAIYEWIVDHTFRDPAVRGCGIGDIRFMLETQNFGGKCADINALFVGLCRASGVPARDVYGLRVGPSKRFTSLGLKTDNATTAQHCRAEVYLVGFGWVPVDPADVRKVALEEPPGHLDVSNAKVRDARARLFGTWEMNWVAFNTAHDVMLPKSPGRTLPYFMYPQAETANGRADSLDPAAFRYEIAVRDVT